MKIVLFKDSNKNKVMKTSRHHFLSLFGIIFLGSLLIFTSCKKDRIQQDDYQDMESFYNDNEEDEQELTVDSTGSGSCFMVAAKGTRICVTRDMLQDLNGVEVPSYPFKLKVIELYSVKDMILRRQPSVANGGILKTSAEVRVRPFKDGSEVYLKPGRKYLMETATISPLLAGMVSYYGFDNGGYADWTSSLSAIVPGFVDTLSSVNNTSNTYFLTPAKTGYVSAASPYPAGSTLVPLTLTVPGTNTQNLQAYISFGSFKGVMRIFNLVSFPVPVGETVTLVVFGKKQTNEYVLHQQTLTIAPGMQIPLTMQVVSESALLAALAAL
jgi:hypothetical protein